MIGRGEQYAAREHVITIQFGASFCPCRPNDRTGSREGKDHQRKDLSVTSPSCILQGLERCNRRTGIVTRIGRAVKCVSGTIVLLVG